MFKRKLLTLVISLCLLGVGCAARIDPVTGISTDATPYEQALALNASLAITNKAVTRTVISLNETGFIDLDNAQKIVAVTGRVAQLDEEITLILAEGPTYAKANAAELQRLSSQVKESILRLVTAETLGIKNPEKKLQVESQVNSIYALVNQLIEALNRAGVLK